MSVYDDAREAIVASSKESSVYVGADSIRYKKNGTWFAKYTWVIILHMDSKHGCRLFHNSIDIPDYGNIKQRMLQEVSYAIEAASEIIDVVGDRHLEIHIDINPDQKHKSNVALKEAIGYVRGTFGFDPVAKPNSWAATHCADHLVRH
jgi:predicted RNase H-related nuclease YkuK (DUF458 family)